MRKGVSQVSALIAYISSMEANKINTETHGPINKSDHRTRSKPSDISDLSELPLILDSRMAAQLLGIHYKTVEKMARVGEIPGAQIGKTWRFSRDSLIRFCGREASSQN